MFDIAPLTAPQSGRSEQVGYHVLVLETAGNPVGINPHTVTEEAEHFNTIRAVVGDTEGAARSCLRFECGADVMDAIAHIHVAYSPDKFDDGKHRDGKYDGDIRKGDFEAVRDNKHGDSSWIDIWTAARLLNSGQHDIYGDNRSWYERGAVGFVWEYRDQIALGLAIAATFASGGTGAVLFYGALAVTSVSAAHSCSTGDNTGCAVGVASVATGGLGRGLSASGRFLDDAAQTRLAASRWHPIQTNVTGPILETTGALALATGNAFTAGSLGFSAFDAGF